jgi:hypothetical protein
VRKSGKKERLEIKSAGLLKKIKLWNGIERRKNYRTNLKAKNKFTEATFPCYVTEEKEI